MDASPSISSNDRLRQERIQRNWRQQDLADQIGTTVVTVKRWERGSQQPSAYFRIKLCALFGKSAEELGLGDVNALSSPNTEREASSESQTSLSSENVPLLWTIPYSRNPHFTGRNELFELLDQHLSVERPGEPVITHQVVLTQPQAIKGLGGIGKTQIAVEYAYRAIEQGRYTYTFWINATNEEALITSFVALANLLPSFPASNETNQHKLVTAIKHWLEQCQQRWLLIFDNADDLPFVQHYLPQQGNGSILFTTRSHAVGSIAASLEVETMGLMEGTHFLLHRAQRLHTTDEEANEATNVVIALDGFPLALDQAGAFIEETGCRFGEYLALYQEHRQTLLARRGMQTTKYPDTVATTWSLSFQKIEQSNPAAAELLQLCAFLAPDHIPEELLKDGAPYWTPLLQSAVTDLLTFNQMIEDLLAFSLVKRLTENQMLSMHRLVQAVQVDRMDPERQRQWAEWIVRAVNAVFPRHPKEDVTSWPDCLRYLEQVQACDTLIRKYGLVFLEAADLIERSGIYLYEHASYELAEALYQQTLTIREQQLGRDHPETATILHNLGLLYRRQGKYERAEPFFQRALAIREQQLGRDHPETATILHSLGTLYAEQGKHEQAEPFFQRALVIREQQLGPWHTVTARSLNNLAALYFQQGKYEQAEPLYQRALAIYEQQLGPSHTHLADSLSNLGVLYFQQGKYEQAEPLYQRALAIREQQLGRDHPATAISLINLEELYFQQGKYEQAELFIQRALAICEQQLGPNHPVTAESLRNLGILYSEQGKYEQAEPLFARALNIQEQTLTAHHPDLANTLHAFACLYETQGSLQQAVDLYQRVLSIREQVYGSHHPKTIETHERLSAMLHLISKTEKEGQCDAEHLEQAEMKNITDERGRVATEIEHTKEM